MLPDVGELEWTAFRAGLRPGTPDNLPVVGRARASGLVWATGHYRNGVLLAPLTGQIVADLLDEARNRRAGSRPTASRPRGRSDEDPPNGEPRELRDGATVVDAVDASGAPESHYGIAVAVDGEVIPRGAGATSRSPRASASRC